MAEKRSLSFENLNQAIDEARRLLNSGYQQHGDWNLSQCCGHLQQWITFPVDGFPNPGPVMGSILWLMKVTIGKSQLKTILDQGFKSGTPTMPSTVPSPDKETDAQAVASLESAVERFNSHSGPIHPSPLFGAMDKQTAHQLQLRHFEHHLGFLSPND